MIRKITLASFLILFIGLNVSAQEHSVARLWNEAILEGVRNDFARPTVHARNLFHSSSMMYDLWAVYDQNAETYFLGNTIRGFEFSSEKKPFAIASINR